MMEAGNLEQTASERLRKGSDLYQPLQIRRDAQFEAGEDKSGSDLVVELGWMDRTYTFYVEVKSRSAPSVVRDTILRMDMATRQNRQLLLVPNLSRDLTKLLQETGASAIDLNGNYFIQQPDLLAVRLDRKNQFREDRDIKNVYAGKSSMVGRFLMANPGPFRQVKEVHQGIAERFGRISVSTVSKVLNTLAEDLLIDKSRESITLIQPDALLAKLRTNYEPPRIGRTIRLKLPENLQDMANALSQALGPANWIWTGETSAEYYTPTTPAKVKRAYARADRESRDLLTEFEEDRFYNCEVQATGDPLVYFDRNGPWSSRLECYFSLSRLDKRERELAELLQPQILTFEQEDVG